MGATWARTDRRRTVRHRVWRRALFFHDEIEPQVGCVADVSRDGLRLETDAPARVGTELDIEVHPSTGEWTGSLRVRGRVVRVSEGGVMGVRLMADPPPRSSGKPRAAYLPRRGSVLPPYALSAARPGRPNWGLWLPAAAVALMLMLLAILPGRLQERAEVPHRSRALPVTVEMEPAPPEQAPDVPAAAPEKAGNGIRLVVDRSEGQVTLYRETRPLRSFPVEFVRARTVPEDESRFAVHTGKRVKSQWLSLGHESIRIRSEDAETLLRFCPVGTPVLVQD